MKSITSKLVVGTLASLAATGMTGGAAFAASSTGTEGYDAPVAVVAEEARGGGAGEAADASRELQRQAEDMMRNPESVTYKITGRISYARAVAVNLAREGQRQAFDVLGRTQRPEL